jgi:multiple sugar transport system permease protein
LAWPEALYAGGFRTAFEEGNLGVYLRNSFIITIPSVIVALICASLASYAIARFEFRLKGLVFVGFLAGMWLPPQAFLFPVYVLTNRLGIYDSYIGLILVHVAYSLPFGVLVLTGFFRTIPGALLDAARIDGAGELRIFTQVVLPLALPAIGAVTIFQFTWIWNDFFWGLAMTQSPGVQPIMIGVTNSMGRLIFNWNGQAVGAVVAMLPPLMVFVAFQRFFIKGVRLGAVK